MVNHGEVWQLKVEITRRFERGDLTVELLKAFVGMSQAELERRLLDSPEEVTVTASISSEASMQGG